ncbi:MAG: hypothetical protein IJK58_09080 [Clostridia bacterium]|nr:hypothetical protein [Clostridia bacterium]
MSTILLSVKPRFAHKLIDGAKKYEYRKRLPLCKVSKIVVYSSFPEKKIIGELEVVDTISMKKSPLWEKTKKESGITRDEYRQYFQGCNLAYAYVVGKAKRYEKPLELSDYDITRAPQSFVYMTVIPE